MASNVQFIISAVDNSKKVFQQVEENLQNLQDEGKATKAEIAAAGAGIVASVGAIGTKAVTEFAAFEKSMSAVRANLQPTADQFENLEDKARELGRQTKFTAEEASDGINMLVKNGLKYEEVMGGAVDATLALASATDSDLSTSADIATDAMASFNLEADQMVNAVNGITGVTLNSKFDINDYAYALGQAGGVAGAVGVEFDDFNATIAAISPLFKSGSDAGTSFKTFLQRLVPTSNTANDAMRDLGIISIDNAGALQFLKDNGITPVDESTSGLIDALQAAREELGYSDGDWIEATQNLGVFRNNLFDTNGQLKSMAEVSDILGDAFNGLSEEQKTAYLNTIFGTDAMRAAVGVANLGSDAFNEMSEAIQGTDAAKIAADRLDNLTGTLTILSAATNDLFISLGELLAPSIRMIAVLLQKLAGVVAKVFSVFQSLPGPIQNIISGFLALTTALIVGTAAWAAFNIVLGGTIAAMGAILAPLAIPIAIFAAITAALILLYEAWDHNFLGIQDITKAVFEWMVSFISTMWNGIQMVSTNGLNSLLTFWTNTWNGIKSIGESIINGIMTFINFQFESMLSLIKAIFQSIIAVGRAFYLLFTGDWEGAWNSISWAFQNIWDVMFEYYSTILNKIISYLGAFTNGVISAFTIFINFLKNIWFEGLDYIGNVGLNSLNGFLNLLGTYGPRLQNGFSNMISGFGNIADNIFNGVLNTLIDFVNTAIGLLNKVINVANEVPGVSISQVSEIEARASGGNITAGQPYLVGEEGPELIIPGQSGYVVNNSDLNDMTSGSNGGGDVNITFGNVTISSGIDLEDFQSTVEKAVIEAKRKANLGLIY